MKKFYIMLWLLLLASCGAGQSQEKDIQNNESQITENNSSSEYIQQVEFIDQNVTDSVAGQQSFALPSEDISEDGIDFWDGELDF